VTVSDGGGVRKRKGYKEGKRKPIDVDVYRVGLELLTNKRQKQKTERKNDNGCDQERVGYITDRNEHMGQKGVERNGL